MPKLSIVKTRTSLYSTGPVMADKSAVLFRLGLYLQLLKYYIRPGRGPGRVHNLEARWLYAIDGYIVNLGEVVKRAEDTVNHAAEDRVTGHSGDSPLAELDLVVDVCPGAAVEPVELDANDEISLVAEFGGNPFVDRFQGNRVGIGINTALHLEDKVSQEVGFHAHVRHTLEGVDDFGSVSKVVSDELVAAPLTN